MAHGAATPTLPAGDHDMLFRRGGPRRLSKKKKTFVIAMALVGDLYTIHHTRQPATDVRVLIVALEFTPILEKSR